MPHNHLGPPDKGGEATESFGNSGPKTLTNAWVLGTAVDVRRFATFGALVDYVKGSENLAVFRVLLAKGATAPAAGASWRPAGELGAAVAGRRALTKGEVSLDPADFDAEDGAALQYECGWADWARVDAKYEGGSAPGSLAVGIAGGWGI